MVAEVGGLCASFDFADSVHGVVHDLAEELDMICELAKLCFDVEKFVGRGYAECRK